MDNNYRNKTDRDDQSSFFTQKKKLNFDRDNSVAASPTLPIDRRRSFSPKTCVDPLTPVHKWRGQDNVQPRGHSSPINRTRMSVNPFTPTGINILKNKYRKGLEPNRSRDSSHNSACVSVPADNETSVSVGPSIRDLMNEGEVTNVSIYELQTSRFNEEFNVDVFIATGTFGEVYKCTHLFDGIAYAVKKSKNTIYQNHEYYIRKEVYAHSVIGRHLNIVSYFTAWHEKGHVYIQTEFCNGGTLELMIHNSDHEFCDAALRRLLCHVCKGLAHIHSKKLAHLDIKSANILICRSTDDSLLFDGDLDDNDETVDKDIVYKIGDFGHTVCVEDVRAIEDGDCRYLPKELLRDDYSQLQKADVFSAALTVYEAATKKHLPKNGPEWHQLRDVGFSLPQIPVLSTGLEKMLKKMVDLDPSNRPNSLTVVKLLLDRRRAAIRQQDEIKVWKFSYKFLESCYSIDTQTPRHTLRAHRRYNRSKLACTKK